jgi:ComF family protein
VPLYRWRLWRRRFNQAALLAASLSRLTGLPADPFILERMRATRQQVGLSATQRAENVRGAFRVPEAARAKIAGRGVLLVDDVYTSGATAKAATRALLRGGAAAVDVLTFARVTR